jgi:ammonium transporter, Amt family
VFTYDLGLTMNGCLTGLVSVTAGGATVETWAAVVMGTIAGLLYLAGSALLIKLRIDDAVDAIPVHLVGGAWGLISAGLFTTATLRKNAFGSGDGTKLSIGLFYELSRGRADFTLLGIQLLAVVSVVAWTAVVMGVFFYALNLAGLFRINPLEEQAGLDFGRHKGPVYVYFEGTAHQRALELLNQQRSVLMGEPISESASRPTVSLQEEPEEQDV